MRQAFILGAGLGTRLRPMTDLLPKPLVPFLHRPLIAWTIEACRHAGIRRFAINTHHLPRAWDDFPALPAHADLDISLFHEPVLLETGGGLKNIRSWIGDQPLLIHNGDVFSTLPLGKLIEAHESGGFPVTLALRSEGIQKQIALDEAGTRVTDLRHALGVAPGTHVFTGIYCVNPDFLNLLPDNEVISVIPAFLELARQGRLGAIVLDEGVWHDLGDREAYLKAHHHPGLVPAVHPTARVADSAVIEHSVIGPGCVVDRGALIRNSVLWPGSRIAADARLERCIVFRGGKISGNHRDADL